VRTSQPRSSSALTTDVFVLASLRKALALVFFKALARDVPVITHGYHVSRFVLQHEGNLTDLSKRAPWPSRTIEALQNRRRTLRGVRVYGTSDLLRSGSAQRTVSAHVPSGLRR
jgi:hypothetical protein